MQVGELGHWCVDGVCHESGAPDPEVFDFLFIAIIGNIFWFFWATPRFLEW